MAEETETQEIHCDSVEEQEDPIQALNDRILGLVVENSKLRIANERWKIHHEEVIVSHAAEVKNLQQELAKYKKWYRGKCREMARYVTK